MWLYSFISHHEVFSSSFNAYIEKIGHHTGQGIFIRSTLRSCQLDVPGNTVESVWCSVGLPDNKKFIVGVFYRPPNSDPASIIEGLLDVVSSVSNDCVLLGGDINLLDMIWGGWTVCM